MLANPHGINTAEVPEVAPVVDPFVVIFNCVEENDTVLPAPDDAAALIEYSLVVFCIKTQAYPFDIDDI